MDGNPSFDIDLDALREDADRRLADYRAAKLALTSEKEALLVSRESLRDAEEAQKIAQIVAQGVQQQAHDRIAGIVTRCLAAVFPNPYEFKINFVQKRGQTEAQLLFVRDGKEVDPLEASGGGMVDVAAFALRLSCVLLSRPASRRFICADEPFKFVSREHRGKLRTVLLKLSKELKVQMLFVTHLPELEIGKVFRLESQE